MEFCLLGSLLVRADAVILPIPRGKQRAVLAVLLLSEGRAVSLDELAETLWGSDCPPSARVAIQNHVMRLRKTLGNAGSRISTQSPGYMIRVDAEELDVTRFQNHLGNARAAARDNSWDAAGAEARAALRLWRGEPLADVDSDVLALREVPRLAEMRLEALEVRIDADLHRGCHAELITELRRLVNCHPLREHLHGQLMLALYRNGRQAEALAAYRAARQVLIDVLGTEPGTGLRELHQQILTADPALTAAQRALPISPGAGPVVPRQLPGSVANFAGREAELAALTGLLDQARQQTPETAVISAISGTAGVGKTALAVHWAHQVAERFPDGQLYVNLRGFDPGAPMSPADALAGFLRALDVPGRDIPGGENERAARYRSLLAGRQMLVMLDNAGQAEQVRPLLPGTPNCVTVVTSRDAMPGLVARDGARRLDLALLPLADAVNLLRTLIGDRADRDPGTCAVLAAQCSRLPLALRVVAELSIAHPATPLAELAAELADEQRRLDLLDAGGDPRAEVRAVFSWSCQHLAPAAERAFRLLGLHPGPDIDRSAAAALIAVTVEDAGQVLKALARAHLIQPTRPGRYSMHDLLRTYAREPVDADGGEQRAALTRVFDYYLHTAAAAMDTLFPAEDDRRPRIPASATPVPPVTDPVHARAWLDEHRPSLVATAVHTADLGWPGYSTRLADILYHYLTTCGHHAEAATVHDCARRAARRCPPPETTAPSCDRGGGP